MLNTDYFFTYKNSLKLLLLLKLNPKNYDSVYSLPYISKLNFFFSLSKVTDKDNISVYNYFYLFKFFFGRNAYLSKYRSYFNLGIWYYSFKVFIIINNKDIYMYYFII
jgi:hypothetical protein